MANAEKKIERARNIRARVELVRSLAGHRPSSSSILASLQRAHVDEQHAAGSLLAREVLFKEDPQATMPEELSDKVVAEYLANAGEFYAGAATDYLSTSDLLRAYKYFRKAARQFALADELDVENGQTLREKARRYRDRTAMARQELARRSVRRKRWSLGLLGRVR